MTSKLKLQRMRRTRKKNERKARKKIENECNLQISA